MSKRVDRLKARILANIKDGVPGFSESLPSLREQTQIFNETHHVVNIALKELEEEDVIRCIPYKGYKVVAQFAKPAAAAPSGESGVIHVLVMENLVWQIEFWCRCIRKFEEMQPNCKVRPYFIAEKKAISALLKNMNGGSVVLIGDLAKIDGEVATLIPRPEIARVSGAPLPEDDLLDGVLEPLDAFSMPYQIQPPLLFCRKAAGAAKYDPDAGYEKFLDWVAQSYGGNSLAPLNMPLMFDSLGLEGIYTLSREQIGKKLKLLLKLAGKMKEHDLLHLGLPEGMASDMKMLASGQLQCTIRGSYCAGAANFPKSADEITIQPPPREQDGRLIQHVCRMAIAGTSCNALTAEFFRFILGRDVQMQIMKDGLGISPCRSILSEAVKAAGDFAYDIDSVIKYVVKESRKASSHGLPARDGKLYLECANFLIDELMIPVLSGKLDPARKGLPAELAERLVEIGERSHQDRRDRNLRDYFMRNI